MAVVTILHVTVTYNVLFSEAAKDVLEILKVIFVSDVGRDILLRTILLGLFMIVLYSIVSIGEFMQEERKNELIKRRQVQEDFTNVVTKIFDVTLDRDLMLEGLARELIRAAQVMRKSANFNVEDRIQIDDLNHEYFSI